MANKKSKPVPLAKAQISAFKQAGLSDAHIDAVAAATAAGLTFVQIITLLMQFGSKYGADLLSIVIALIAAIKAGDIGAIEALAVKWGPEIYAMCVFIGNMLGLTLPPGLPGA
jgi:hypothetical protein